MSETPLNIKQAEGYVQLLMQEGKLEEEIISETCSLFQLKRHEVVKLIHEYKTEKFEQYRQNVSSNLWQKITAMIPLLLFAGLYAVLSVEMQSPFFVPIIVLFVLCIVGLIFYCIKLLSERFDLKRRLYPAFLSKYTSNGKDTIQYGVLVLIMTIVAGTATYNYSKKRYIYTDTGLVKATGLILGDDCSVKRTTGKNRYSYYAFHFKNYEPEFRWKFSMNHQAFVFSQTPDQALKKGDVISIYLKSGDLNSTNDYVFISDIEQNGIRWMDQPERNVLEKESAKRILLFDYGMLAATIIIAVIYDRHLRNKRIS